MAVSVSRSGGCSATTRRSMRTRRSHTQWVGSTSCSCSARASSAASGLRHALGRPSAALMTW
eukprot:14066297-Alexandrium_andersonii.AAC.1